MFCVPPDLVVCFLEEPCVSDVMFRERIKPLACAAYGVRAERVIRWKAGASSSKAHMLYVMQEVAKLIEYVTS